MSAKPKLVLFGILFTAAVQLSQTSVWAAEIKAKYGPEKSPIAQPLWAMSDYFRSSKHPAPQFWSLISYYVPQFTHSSCSVASVTMTLNAARTRLRLSSDDQVVSESALLSKVNVEHWKERTTTQLGYQGKHGATLDQLAVMTLKSFETYGLAGTKVEKKHVNDSSSDTKEKIIQDLKNFESNPDIFIIANFDQKSFTDDVNAGHISPVGAYDSDNQKVLILDSDREYFSPYWVSLDAFIGGMNTTDELTTNHSHRGYLNISVKKAP